MSNDPSESEDITPEGKGPDEGAPLGEQGIAVVEVMRGDLVGVGLKEIRRRLKAARLEGDKEEEACLEVAKREKSKAWWGKRKERKEWKDENGIGMNWRCHEARGKPIRVVLWVEVGVLVRIQTMGRMYGCGFGGMVRMLCEEAWRSSGGDEYTAEMYMEHVRQYRKNVKKGERAWSRGARHAAHEADREGRDPKRPIFEESMTLGEITAKMRGEGFEVEELDRSGKVVKR